MTHPQQAPDRNLALDLIRVTEAAAMASSRYMGRGDKNGADGAAVNAMRVVLASVPMDGVVVIGEGEKDDAPDALQRGADRRRDAARRSTSRSTRSTAPPSSPRAVPGALAVIALSERGTMFDPGPCVYMEKIAVGPRGRGCISIKKCPTENLEALAEQLEQPVRDLIAVILDRDRHDELVDEVRAAGARVRLITDGDVAGAISTAWDESDGDILFGIGGTPEGVIAAAALKCLGGEIQGRLWPRNDDERAAAEAADYDLDKVLTTDDLVGGDNCFFSATGITDGELLRGVRFHDHGAMTQSLVMRSLSGTVRKVDGFHRLDKLQEISSVAY